MRSFLRILPDGFLGMEDINATRRILLYGATCIYNPKHVKPVGLEVQPKNEEIFRCQLEYVYLAVETALRCTLQTFQYNFSR